MSVSFHLKVTFDQPTQLRTGKRMNRSTWYMCLAMCMHIVEHQSEAWAHTVECKGRIWGKQSMVDIELRRQNLYSMSEKKTWSWQVHTLCVSQEQMPERQQEGPEGRWNPPHMLLALNPPPHTLTPSFATPPLITPLQGPNPTTIPSLGLKFGREMLSRDT